MRLEAEEGLWRFQIGSLPKIWVNDDEICINYPKVTSDERVTTNQASENFGRRIWSGRVRWLISFTQFEMWEAAGVWYWLLQVSGYFFKHCGASKLYGSYRDIINVVWRIKLKKPHSEFNLEKLWHLWHGELTNRFTFFWPNFIKIWNRYFLFNCDNRIDGHQTSKELITHSNWNAAWKMTF